MYKSLFDVINANRAAGYDWFDRETMDFFDSKIELEVFPTSKGAYFVSSEQLHGPDGYVTPRLFSVRFIDAEGRVTTSGDFQGHDTKADAITAIADLL